MGWDWGKRRIYQVLWRMHGVYTRLGALGLISDGQLSTGYATMSSDGL